MNRYYYYLPVLLLTGVSFFSSCLLMDDDDCLARDPVVASAFSSYNSAWLEVRGGDPPYTYLWSNGATSDSISNLPRSGGTYTVTVTDSEGCSTADSVVIAPWGCLGISSISDSEGNTYQVVEIGRQCWMAENLKSSGNAQLVTDENQWKNLSNAPAWCYYDNDPTTGGTYGKLYNGWAMLNGNLCPTGWHVATAGDWAELSTHLGGGSIAGGKMKVVGTGYWKAPNTGATNSSGFSGLPGGSRRSDGVFVGLETSGTWWSSTPTNECLPNNYFTTELNYNYEDKGGEPHARRSGLSCRCVKD